MNYFVNKEKSNWISISELENKLKSGFSESIFNELLIPLAVENLIEIKE